MKYYYGMQSIFEILHDALVIPTFGNVRKDGSLVMNDSISKEAQQLFKNEKILGELVQEHGHHVIWVDEPVHNLFGEYHLILLPIVSRADHDQRLIRLIGMFQELANIINEKQLHNVIIPPIDKIYGLDYIKEIEPVLKVLMPFDTVTVYSAKTDQPEFESTVPKKKIVEQIPESETKPQPNVSSDDSAAIVLYLGRQDVEKIQNGEIQYVDVLRKPKITTPIPIYICSNVSKAPKMYRTRKTIVGRVMCDSVTRIECTKKNKREHRYRFSIKNYQPIQSPEPIYLIALCNDNNKTQMIMLEDSKLKYTYFMETETLKNMFPPR
jgi:hypothetical protein